MTNAELIAKIKAEIERRWKHHRRNFLEREEDGDKMEEDAYLLQYLSDLEKSKNPMNQEGLEKDVERWFFNEISSKINVVHSMYYYFQECARRYAQWGAEHAREQMMKGAVPFYEILEAVPPGPERENVRIIIVKDD